MQLSFFPSLLPDEPVYSLVARYHKELGYSSFKDTVVDLFNCRSISSNIELPSRLGVLSERLPWKGLNADHFIWGHTAVPYYSFFISQELQQGLIRAVKSSPPPSAPAVIGSMTQRIRQPAFFQYCEECIINDREQFGNAYWHRVHQLPGIKVCPHHNVTLQTTDIGSKNCRLRYEFITLEAAVMQKKRRLCNGAIKSGLYVSIALDSLWILDRAKEGPDLVLIQAALQSRMKLFDWMTSGGSLRARTLRQAWNEQYSLKFRVEMDCGLDRVTDPIPLIRNLVLGGRSFVHPLIGVLIIRLLGLSVHKLSELITEPRYLSREKASNYYCVNPICPDVNTGRWVFEEVSKHDVKRNMITCSRCGMVYTQGDLLSRDPHIIERGSLWLLKLKELIEPGCNSLRKISRELGVDSVTVKRFAAKCCISGFLKNNGDIPSKNDQIIKVKRQLWRELRVENKYATRTELRNLKPALWVWLKRNDDYWLKANLPAKKQAHRGGKKIDRNEQDKQLCLALAEEVKRVLNEEGRPIQVTHTELARRLGNSDLFRKKFIGYFPKTTALAEKLTETREEFAKRRIKRSGEQFFQEGKIPKRWELVRRAGLRPDMEACCDKVINQVLENLGAA